MHIHTFFSCKKSFKSSLIVAYDTGTHILFISSSSVKKKQKNKYYELIPLGTPLLQHFVAIQFFDNIKLYSGYNFNLMAKGNSKELKLC